MHFLDSISSKYTSFGVSDRDLCLPSYMTVGKGSVSIMWRSALSNNISVLDIQSTDDRGKYMQCYVTIILYLSIHYPGHISYRSYKLAKSLFRSFRRKVPENYLSELNAEIDQIAEVCVCVNSG